MSLLVANDAIEGVLLTIDDVVVVVVDVVDMAVAIVRRLMVL